MISQGSSFQPLKWLWHLLTDGMITHPGYPGTIQLPHAIYATAMFRSSFPAEMWDNVPIWHRLIGAFFCHGYGGSTLRDLLLGCAPSLTNHPTVPSYFLAGSLLTYFSPCDIIYRMYEQPRHPFRLLIRFIETVDMTTTTLGAFEKAVNLKPDSPLAPYAVAIMTGMGGSIARYFERKGRGWTMKAEWTSPSGTIQKGVVFTFAYALLRRAFGIRAARLWFTLFTCWVDLCAELCGWQSNPYAELCDVLLARLERARLVLRLGPPGPSPTVHKDGVGVQDGSLSNCHGMASAHNSECQSEMHKVCKSK